MWEYSWYVQRGGIILIAAILNLLLLKNLMKSFAGNRIWAGVALGSVEAACYLIPYFVAGRIFYIQEMAAGVLLFLLCFVLIQRGKGTENEERAPEKGQMALLFVIPVTGMLALLCLFLGELKPYIFSALCCGCILAANLSVFYLYHILVQNDAHIRQRDIYRQQTDHYRNQLEVIEESQKRIRALRHDMKNQLSVLSILLKDKKYDEANTILTDLCDSVDSAKTAISGNIFIDAILKQKMNEYADIAFHLDLQITKDFVFDGKYLISLLSNIIDNACEELRRIHESSFQLKINGNRSQLLIVAQNKCRETIDFQTDKDLREHGYGLKIIQEITNKYDGTLITDVKNGVFEIRVLLLFANEN